MEVFIAKLGNVMRAPIPHGVTHEELSDTLYEYADEGFTLGLVYNTQPYERRYLVFNKETITYDNTIFTDDADDHFSVVEEIIKSQFESKLMEGKK